MSARPNKYTYKDYVVERTACYPKSWKIHLTGYVANNSGVNFFKSSVLAEMEIDRRSKR